MVNVLINVCPALQQLQNANKNLKWNNVTQSEEDLMSGSEKP